MTETAPDNTAVRVALWRALHVEVDARPHVLEDMIGLQLVAPEAGWRARPDMHVERTARARATIVGRARFIEELVVESGVAQYVLLGAGLDSFAQRRPAGAAVRVFEVDQAGTQAWKRRRLAELGLATPEWLRFVAVDFEAGASWLERLVAEGFDAGVPALVASVGVSMYITKEATRATRRQAATLAPGSRLVMTFQLPAELIEAEERPGREMTERGARAAGTPFISYFTPAELVALAREAGFEEVRHVSAAELTERYFAGRSDGLRPSSADELVVATT